MDDREVHFPLLRNRLKEVLTGDGVSLCLRVTFASASEIPFLADAAGFDALYVDLEHSPTTVADAARTCGTATALGITPLARLTSVHDTAAVTLLDAGCQGLIAPQVETAAQARVLVERCLFGPLGHRPVTGPALHLGYQSLRPGDAASLLNGAVVLAVMVESERAVDRIDEIASVQGIDLVLVGTQDLTCSLGIPGRSTRPSCRRCASASRWRAPPQAPRSASPACTTSTSCRGGWRWVHGSSPRAQTRTCSALQRATASSASGRCCHRGRRRGTRDD